MQKHNNGRRGHREGERVHLLAVISVTAPVFHFETSQLNADAEVNTAIRESATKKRKDKPTTNNNKGTVSSTQKQKESNV